MTLDLQALQAPITRILTAPNVDLSTISAKRVRKVLREDPEYAFLGLTTEMLKVNREAVDGVIARIFESVSREAREGGGQSEGGSKRKRKDDDGEEGGEGEGEPSEPSEEADADADAEEVDNAKVHAPKKKKKGKKTVEESDAELARKLSSEINSRSRRGSANVATSSPRKAKRKPKKSAETVDSEEDEEPKPKKRSTAKGGFAKEYLLSEPLSAVLGVEKLSRPQVVKKLWEYIRSHELQNPSNKREIICDGGLRPVFAVDKIDMFRMNKVLGQHLHEE